MDNVVRAGMSDVTSASRSLRRWSSEQDRVFDLQLEFNLFPARYAHSSWRAPIDIDQPGVGAIWDEPIEPTPFWMRNVSTRLLNEAGLQDSFDCDFSDVSRRFALLDAKTLQQLGQFAAAVLVRHRLQHIVDRAAVERLQQVIGAAAHRFALRWAHPMPRLPAEFSRWDEPLPTPEAWLARQASIAQSVVSTDATAVRGRLRFKFPRHALAPPMQLSEVQRIALMRLLLIVVSAEFPEWGWLFASEAAALPVARSES